jgi:hypothetical protein
MQSNRRKRTADASSVRHLNLTARRKRERPGREALEVGPELVVQPRLRVAVAAGPDAVEHLGVGLRLAPPAGRTAATSG